VLIFGSSAVQSAVDGGSYAGQLAVMGGFLLVALALAPAAVAGGLRISVDQ
jgi:heme exporter protein B